MDDVLSKVRLTTFSRRKAYTIHTCTLPTIIINRKCVKSTRLGFYNEDTKTTNELLIMSKTNSGSCMEASCSMAGWLSRVEHVKVELVVGKS